MRCSLLAIAGFLIFVMSTYVRADGPPPGFPDSTVVSLPSTDYSPASSMTYTYVDPGVGASGYWQGDTVDDYFTAGDFGGGTFEINGTFVGTDSVTHNWVTVTPIDGLGDGYSWDHATWPPPFTYDFVMDGNFIDGDDHEFFQQPVPEPASLLLLLPALLAISLRRSTRGSLRSFLWSSSCLPFSSAQPGLIAERGRRSDESAVYLGVLPSADLACGGLDRHQGFELGA